MSLPKSTRLISPGEYYELERAADFKSEFFQGEVFAMAGSSTRHSLITMNLLGELRQLCKGRPCTPYTGDQRIKVPATSLRTYPDASLFCEPMEYDAEDAARETAINPSALFEVLSGSTEGYDRGTKSAHYRLIPSLRVIGLISQEEARIELLEKTEDGGWRLTEAVGKGSTLPVASIGLVLSLAEIYDRVEFERQTAGLRAVVGEGSEASRSGDDPA